MRYGNGMAARRAAHPIGIALMTLAVAACLAAAEALRGGSARAVAWLAERGVLARWGADAGS